MIILTTVILSALVIFLPLSYQVSDAVSFAWQAGLIYALGILAIFNSWVVRRRLFTLDQFQRCFALLIFYVFLQYVGTHLGVPLKSIYAYVTRQEFLRLFSFFLLIQLVIAYATPHRSVIWWILGSAVLAGYAVSFCSLYRLFFKTSNLPTLDISFLSFLKIHPNRNNTAAFLELLTPIAFSITYYRFEHARARIKGGVHDFVINLLMKDGWFLLLLNVSATLLLGVISNLSKFSLISLATSFTITFILLNQSRRFSRSDFSWIAIFFGGVALTTYLVGGAFSSRFIEADTVAWQTLDMRVPFWERAFPLFQKFFWLGSGAGTFSEVFVGFHRVTINYFSLHLLNDYLELGIELGVVGLVIYMISWFFLFKMAIQRIIKEQSYFRRYIAIGIISGLSSFLIRQLIIANFYDVANAFYAYLFAGILIAIGHESEREKFIYPEKRTNPPNQVINRLFFVVLMCAALLLFSREQIARAFLGKRPLEMSYKRAFAVDSENADYPYRLSKIYRNKAIELSDPSRRIQKLREAQIRLEQAILLSPYQLKYRLDYSEISLLKNHEAEGDKIFDFPARELPFDAELMISRALFWAKIAEAKTGEERLTDLSRAAFYLTQSQPTNVRQSDFNVRLKEKRFSVLSESIRSELSEVSA